MHCAVLKIILHAGTPKTGTTSLQSYLHAEREQLRAGGTLYPAIELRGGLALAVPKHQWLIRLLRSGAAAELLDRVDIIAKTEATGCERMILSTEGLFNHWLDIAPAGRDALRTLAARYQVEMCVWFRDPVAYARSYYCQLLKNPPENHPLYGRDLSVDQLLDDRWFRRQLEYDRFVDEVTTVLGPGTVKPFAYGGDTVEAFCDVYGLPRPGSRPGRENVGLKHFGVDALRALNRHRNAGEAREAAVAAIVRLDRSVASAPFMLSEAETARVHAISDHGLTILRRRFGLVLPPG